MTREQIEAIERLLAKATPGPWWAQREYDGGRTVCSMRHQTETVCINKAAHVEGDPWDAHVDNANLIEALRNNATALLAAARRALELEAALEKTWAPKPYDEWHDDHSFVLWFSMPICEPPYVGAPLCSDWPYGNDVADLWWVPLPDDRKIMKQWEAIKNARRGM